MRQNTDRRLMAEAEAALRLILDMREVLRAVRLSSALEQRMAWVSGQLEFAISAHRIHLNTARRRLYGEAALDRNEEVPEGSPDDSPPHADAG